MVGILHLIRYYSGKKYLVTGDVLPFVGMDGEPLIKNVKILKEIAYGNRKYKV